MSQADIISYFLLTNNKPSLKEEISKTTNQSHGTVDKLVAKMGEVESLLTGHSKKQYKLKEEVYRKLKE